MKIKRITHNISIINKHVFFIIFFERKKLITT